jgi:serine/threonine protein kinase
MPAPATVEQFLDLLRRSSLLDEKTFAEKVEPLRAAAQPPAGPQQLARTLVREGLLTRFQAEQLLQGKSRGFSLAGKYRLLEHLGSGGMGMVYLCEHISMRRRVAIKVLPVKYAEDASYLERFYREARAVAALDHPNIVRAHDIDQDGKLHFLVMEYVEGGSLQDIVSRFGALDINRAAHYMSQAAWGLEHAHEAGLVHRDIKPGNLIVDRSGTVKILDMGLARFFHDDDNLSKRFDETVLGTSDYLAPEQTLDSNVDIRADIYSLGATFYFCLTGQTIFGEGKTAQKLIWHQTRQPKPIRSLRPEVSEELAAVVDKMLAKDPAQRYQTPGEVCAALAPWTSEPIPPPPAEQMPRLSPAATREGRGGPSSPHPQGKVSPSSVRSWKVSGTAVVRPAAPGNEGGAAATAVSTAPAVETPPAVRAETPTETSPPASAAVNGRMPRKKAAAPLALQPDKPEGESSTSRRRPARHGAWPMWAALAVAVAGLGAGGTWWVLRGGHPEKQQQQVTLAKQARAPAAPDKVGTPRAAPIAGGLIRADKDGYHVKTPTYEVLIGPDGNLSSLRVGKVEFLRPGLRFGANISRGSYFFFEKEQPPVGVVKLPTIEQPGPNLLKASGDRFSILYEFGPDAVSLKLNNATDHTVPFYMVFDPGVVAAMNEQGETVRLPARKEWPTTSWLSGRAKLTLTGGNRIWGPWEQGTQVWEASLTTYETRQVVLTAAAASENESARVAEALAAGGSHHVQQAGYDAVVEDDGCLTSLRSQGVEFLRAGVDISRGLYVLTGRGLARMTDIAEPARDVLTASGELAAVRYEFGPDTITCTAENRTNESVPLFIVFDAGLVALRDGSGQWHKTPTALHPDTPIDKKWATTTWFAGAARLTITGGSRVWGPWSDLKLQVWEARLAPKETRKVVLQTGSATQAEIARVAELGGRPVVRLGLDVQAPRDYEVFQRRTRLEGQVRLRGRVLVPADRLEARLTGTALDGPLPDSWQPLRLAEKTRAFQVALPGKAGGWYKLELRAFQGDKEVSRAGVDHVGIGEVFVGAGQSNSTNCGQERIKQDSGMVSTFDGQRWRLADDPQPGVHDNSQGGSYWPAFGDAMYERYHVPIGVASVGHSGTSVNQWQPGGELFRWMMARIYQLGPHGCRALLWHQGESDVGMSAAEYAHQLEAVIRGTQRAAGWELPWFVARVSYHNPQSPSFPTTREAQKKLWDQGVALEGPDTDLLTGDNRDEGGRGIHFSPRGLHAHGRLWADRVAAYLDRVLGK